MELLSPTRLATLGHPQRLALFRLLMRRYPDQVPAQELATALGLKPSTLSAYLNALMSTGLIRQQRAGTSLRYTVDMKGVNEIFDYLLNDCARGRTELFSALTPPSEGPRPMDKTQPQNVLFICTGNSARSIFAEILLRDIGGPTFNVYSAGTKPRSELNPYAVEILKQNEHDTSQLRAKNISEFQTEDAPVFDFVFTVCDQAANEDCPAWHGQPISGHWGLPDPVKATGTDAEKSLAFQTTYGALRRRITAFAALPLTQLDRISLQTAVDTLAHTPET